MKNEIHSHIESFNKQIKELKKGTTDALRRNDSSPSNKYMYAMSKIMDFDTFLMNQDKLEKMYFNKGNQEAL